MPRITFQADQIATFSELVAGDLFIFYYPPNIDDHEEAQERVYLRTLNVAKVVNAVCLCDGAVHYLDGGFQIERVRRAVILTP